MTSGERPTVVGLERRVALGLGAQRVQARGEVAVRAVGLEQRGRGLHGLQHLLVDDALAGRRRRRASRAAAAAAAGAGGTRRRAELGAQRGEDAVVEAVVALQVGLDDLQEAPRLRALDDAVVVGRGHGHDLLGADHVADVLQAHRVGDRAGGHDRALADHQARDGRDGADPARVGERDVGAREVVGGQRVGARLLDELVEGGLEVGEVLAARVADDGDHERAACRPSSPRRRRCRG